MMRGVYERFLFALGKLKVAMNDTVMLSLFHYLARCQNSEFSYFFLIFLIFITLINQPCVGLKLASKFGHVFLDAPRNTWNLWSGN
jgi:hypothetical protein